jgi:tetratricopeptide (TPR) repeat protein
LADIRLALGRQSDLTYQDGTTTLIYHVEPFSRVEIVVTGDVCQSVVIHLKTPTPPNEIAGELDLGDYRPASIPDESGQLLGQAYPERGIVFVFAAQAQSPLVAHIVLEPITAEAFILRVLHDAEHQYQPGLADLDFAQQLAPKDGRIPWLRAKILAAIGRHKEALKSADEALKLNPASAAYQLTRAEVLGAMGQYDEAVQQASTVASSAGVAAEIKARAECQLGDLIAAGPVRNYKDAMQHHMAAIQLAAPLANDANFEVRQSAKRVLVDAHLAVANDIARGDWQRKAETVSKWLSSASELASNMIEHDGGDPSLKLLVDCQSLRAYEGLGSQIDPTNTARDAIDEGRTLIAEANDPLYQQELAWQLGAALFDAAQVERLRGDVTRSLQYASNALALLVPDDKHQETTAVQDFLLGRLYFLGGSIYAIHKNDHQHAVAWFEKAAPKLSRTLPESLSAERAIHGERFVSMGVSYFQTGSREQAIELTMHGIQLLRLAVESGTAHSNVLQIPYGNLASMHQQMGNVYESKKYAELARKHETGKSVK